VGGDKFSISYNSTLIVEKCKSLTDWATFSKSASHYPLILANSREFKKIVRATLRGFMDCRNFRLDAGLFQHYDENPMEISVMTLDPEQLRHAMRAWSSGVTVVTAAHDGEQHGMTVSSFTSVSLEPPLIIISLHTESRTHRLVHAAGAFAVSILGADQSEISDRFAGRDAEHEDRFADLEMETLVSGAPAVKDALARLDCRVIQVISAGMNTIFLAEVLAARSDGVGKPLVYHNRRYWDLM
jgi:flavin reductase (DIM6/NTAB) family NADH-FMN oxidoreductase RutF